MKKRNWILAAVLACTCVTVSAQESKEEPKGKAIIQVFGNFHTGFGDNNDDRGFELDRSYLGYQYDLGKGLQIKGVMDIGQSDDVNDYHRIAYIKNAQITWKTGNWTFNGGLISTIQFNMQEKFWGYRYVMKSFQDIYKFGSSADLGISAAYKFNDWLSADAIVVNGEGYKKVQVDDGLAYGLGLTMNLLDGLSIRLYGGMNEASEEGLENAYNLATFVGYKNKDFSIGAEYNSYMNSGYIPDANQSGFSLYTSLRVSDKVSIFGRTDCLSSKDDWNEKNDGILGLAGVDIKLNKYIQISPNFRMWKPKADGLDNEYMAYISCRFGL